MKSYITPALRVNALPVIIGGEQGSGMRLTEQDIERQRATVQAALTELGLEGSPWHCATAFRILSQSGLFHAMACVDAWTPAPGTRHPAPACCHTDPGCSCPLNEEEEYQAMGEMMASLERRGWSLCAWNSRFHCGAWVRTVGYQLCPSCVGKISPIQALDAVLGRKTKSKEGRALQCR